MLSAKFHVEFGNKFPKSSFLGNEALRSYCHQFSPHSERIILSKERNPKDYTTVYLLVALFLALSVYGGRLYVSRLPAMETSLETLDSKHGDIFRIWNYDGKIAYEDVVGATGDFDIGHYGIWYRAELPNRRIVALKKLHSLEGENPIFDKCFRRGAQILTEIRHRSIVKLFGFSLHKRLHVSHLRLHGERKPVLSAEVRN